MRATVGDEGVSEHEMAELAESLQRLTIEMRLYFLRWQKPALYEQVRILIEQSYTSHGDVN